MGWLDVHAGSHVVWTHVLLCRAGLLLSLYVQNIPNITITNLSYFKTWFYHIKFTRYVVQASVPHVFWLDERWSSFHLYKIEHLLLFFHPLGNIFIFSGCGSTSKSELYCSFVNRFCLSVKTITIIRKLCWIDFLWL